MLDFDFPPEVCARLRALGADPHTIYHGMNEFELEHAVQPYKTNNKFFKTKTTAVVPQLENFIELLEDPLHGCPIAVLSSFPSDARAKAAALHVFRNAVLAAGTKVRKPRWVTLYGDRFDYEKLKQQRPSMLVITNVIMDSTQYKMERLRDLLEMFRDIPRVVVTGGSVDPTELFIKRLHLPLNIAVSIGPETVVKNILDLMEIN
ncbi:DNA polymerase [Yersinia phage fHe-Yen9-02]|nr:DNA polymerase [Yersinia phage fHe-Yen9-02]